MSILAFVTVRRVLSLAWSLNCSFVAWDQDTTLMTFTLPAHPSTSACSAGHLTPSLFLPNLTSKDVSIPSNHNLAYPDFLFIRQGAKLVLPFHSFFLLSNFFLFFISLHCFFRNLHSHIDLFVYLVLFSHPGFFIIIIFQGSIHHH